ncbi:LptF/LptG family permease [Peredibacter sp. HCB2-198]|uniref:LptF/LptG family permease n=1 Tax=Peredibacter sp. HCB2-198 TaxID=3383025 RepID=UPI0038B582CD
MKLLLQRYLAAQFVLPLVVSTIFFISFLLTFELFRMTELLVTRDISLWFTLKLIGNIALTFVPLSLPIAVFFSTIYCLNRISGDSEYIAMRAGGMTKFKILLPFLIIAGLLTVSVYQLNQTVIPKSNKAFKQKLNYLTSSGLLAGIKEGQFFTLIPSLTLFASKSTKYGRNLDEVFLHIQENPQNSKVIFAKRGELIFERDAESLTEKLTLVLHDGNIVGQAKGTDQEKILFSKYVFPVSQQQFEDRLSIKETMLSSKELEGVLKMTPEEAEKAYRFNKKEFFNAKYEFWNRKNGAFVCFIFCFLGFTLGVTGNRGKGKNSGLIGLLCLILYYGLYFSLVSFAKKEVIPIPVAVFLPVTVMTGLGLWFYRKLDWQS